MAQLNGRKALVAEPEGNTDEVVLLASDQSRYICNALIEVNEGKSIQ